MAINTRRPQENPDHFGGAIVREKRRTIAAKQGEHLLAELNLLDADGVPINLATSGISLSSQSEDSDSSSSGVLIEDDPQILVAFREAAEGCEAITAVGALVRREDAFIRIELPAAVCATPGVWLMEVAVTNVAQQRLFSNTAWLAVEPSLFSGTVLSGPPMLAEVRLFLRDYAQENELLDAFDFDPSEVMLAANLCVQYFNEINPPIDQRFSTSTFPYRYHWLIGITSHLFSIAEEHYRRNHLPYNAGGTAVDDKAKAPDYAQKAQLARQEWQQFARERKVSLNIEAGYGGIGSPYGYMGY